MPLIPFFIAKYIENKYGIPITTTEKRIYDGKTEEDCKISKYECRSKWSGTFKGAIKVTDTVTGEVFIFNNRYMLQYINAVYYPLPPKTDG